MYAIEFGVDDMENGKNAKEISIKLILLIEMNKVLLTISDDTDSNIKENLKSEGFEFLQMNEEINIRSIKPSFKLDR